MLKTRSLRSTCKLHSKSRKKYYSTAIARLLSSDSQVLEFAVVKDAHRYSASACCSSWNGTTQ